MGTIFDEVVQAQEREREREERERQREQRFATIEAAFARLSRDEQLLIVARLATRLESSAGELRAPQPAQPPRTFTIPARSNGDGSKTGRQLSIIAPPRRIADPKAITKETPTTLTRRVLREATRPMAIDEIIAAVLSFAPNTPKPEIYSAVYKAKARDEFLFDEGLYAVNHDFHRVRGRKPAA